MISRVLAIVIMVYARYQVWLAEGLPLLLQYMLGIRVCLAECLHIYRNIS